MTVMTLSLEACRSLWLRSISMTQYVAVLDFDPFHSILNSAMIKMYRSGALAFSYEIVKWQQQPEQVMIAPHASALFCLLDLEAPCPRLSKEHRVHLFRLHRLST